MAMTFFTPWRWAVDGHEQVVDHEFQARAVEGGEKVYEHHAVESAKWVVADENHAAVCRSGKAFGVYHAVGDVELAEHRMAEFGIA